MLDDDNNLTNLKVVIDQSLLETVIPKISGKVKILKKCGLQGQNGILKSLLKDNFSGSILLDSGTSI